MLVLALSLSGWSVVFNLATALLLGLALVASYRTTRHRANDVERERFIEVQRSELAIWQDRAERLETEVATARSELARLQGMVAEQQEEIISLRNMLMGTTVQPALYDAMETVAREAVHSLRETLEDALAPIRDGIESLRKEA